MRSYDEMDGISVVTVAVADGENVHSKSTAELGFSALVTVECIKATLTITNT